MKKQLSAVVDGSDLVIRVSAGYLKNSAECALTTGGEKTVTNITAMLVHYAEAIQHGDDNSHLAEGYRQNYLAS